MQPMQPMMGVPGMVPMGGVPGMVPMQGVGMGLPMHQPTVQLPPGYELPRLSYTPDRGWGLWDLASRHYSGNRLERSWLDGLMSRVNDFMGDRQLSEDAAYHSFVRVYHKGDGVDAGNRSLGGAAAFQAYLLWVRDHWQVYSQNSHEVNMTLIAGMAVAELHRLWDVVDPRSSRAKIGIASEYAAATVRYLYDRHFIQTGYGVGHPQSVAGHASGYHRAPYSYVERRRRRRDSDSDSSSSGRSRCSRRHSRRYDDYPQPPPVMQPGVPMQPGMMAGAVPGVPMQPGMPQQYGYPQQPYGAGYQYAPGYAGQQAYVPQAGAAGYYPAAAGAAYYPGVVDPNLQYRDPTQYAQGQYPQGYYPQAYGYPQQGYRYY